MSPINGDDDYGQVDAKEFNDTTENGLRADVRVIGAGNVSCQYISSVAVASATGNGYFEFGYIIGWWGSSPRAGVDHNHYYAEPTIFNSRVTDSGAGSCTFWPDNHPSESTYRNMRASDINANTYWGSYYEGTAYQPDGVNMDFSHGTGVVNMERGAQSDSGYARYQAIQEYHQSNSWTDTDNVDVYGDVDNAYDYVRISGHEGKVQ